MASLRFRFSRPSVCCWLVGHIAFLLMVGVGTEKFSRRLVAQVNTAPEPRIVDWDARTDLQVIVDRQEGQYLGHPTTCLLDDGKTILCVYPKGHGKGPIVFKKSADGGLTWSDRLKTPENWETSKETPTIHQLVGPDGKKRLVVFSGLYPARMATSEDNGESWSPLEKIGDWGGIVVMGSVVPLNSGPGHYLALFHDDGRFLSTNAKPENPVVFKLLGVTTTDGGVTWSTPKIIWSGAKMHLCEPGVIRSPDQKRLACLLRENRRVAPSQIIFSDDEGLTWSDPQPLPLELCGDRHTARYTPDGRLVISYRQVAPQGQSLKFDGDWVAWVGTFDDLTRGGRGEFLIRLKDNLKGRDCAYPGVEVLPDGTIVVTTYGHWTEGQEPYILSVRFKLSDL